MPTALVTGSAGFIGRHITKRLRDDGWFVVGVDIAYRASGILGGQTFERGDALDYFRDHQSTFDLAVHCAALVGGRGTIEGSPLAVATNLALDSWFFRWLLRSGTPRAVYYSSSAAYPVWLQTGERPRRLTETDIDLTHPDVPDATYGLVKLTGELLAAEARKAGVDVKVLRPFSGYGTDQSLDYPFPSFIARATSRANPFEIWGSGRQVRDWVHVDDVVGATMAALDHDIGYPLNICSGTPTYFDDLARMVIEQTPNYQPQLEPHEEKPSGVQHRVGDPTLMERIYKPKVSLKEGVERALRTAQAA